jgi:phage tail sheath gpL-like
VQADRTVTLEQVVSENKTNSSGVPDTSWRFIKAAKVTARVRYDWITFTSLQYPNNKLVNDGSLAAEYDPTIATPSRVKGSWAARSNLYEKNGWIENSAVTAKASVFVRDANDSNRLDAQQQIQIIGNLFVLAGVLEFQS